jgi:hypothetical protein
LPDDVRKKRNKQQSCCTYISKNPDQPITYHLTNSTTVGKPAIAGNKGQGYTNNKHSNDNISKVTPNRKDFLTKQKINTYNKKECADEE